MPVQCGGTYTVDTAKGQNSLSGYEGDSCQQQNATFSFPAKEAVFSFTAQRSSDVTFWFDNNPPDLQTSTTWILFAMNANGTTCGEGLDCLSTTETSGRYSSTPQTFQVTAGDSVIFALDGRLFGEHTTIATVHITCANEVICGDGVIGRGETCDVGTPQANDGCSDSCQVEQGWGCRGEPSQCHVIECGDGYIDGTEKCDDGRKDDGDGCSMGCTLEQGWYCAGEPSVCVETTGETCAEAMPVDAPMTLIGDTTGYANNVSWWAGLCGSGMSGKDQFYKINVPAHTILYVHDTTRAVELSLMLSSNCPDSAASCVHESDTSDLRWLNNTDSVVAVYLAVDGSLSSDFGPYQLAVEFLQPTNLASGETCVAAERLTVSDGATTTVDSTTAGMRNYYHGYLGDCADDYESGPGKFPGSGRASEKVYVVSVPANKKVSAWVSATISSPVVAITEDCSDVVNKCRAWANTYVSATPEKNKAVVQNTTAAPVDMFVVVDGFLSYDVGNFKLNVSIGD